MQTIIDHDPNLQNVLYDIRHRFGLHVIDLRSFCHGNFAYFRNKLIIYTNLFLLEY